MGGNSAEKRKQMKRKKEVALLLLTAVLAAAGCADEKTTGEKTTESGSAAAVSGSSVFDGDLEENVTIRVLENDTAISKGYFEELITAFNEAYADPRESRRWMPTWISTWILQMTDLMAMDRMC